MEISFAGERISSPLKSNCSPKEISVPAATREGKVDSVSGNIRAGLNAGAADPQKLLEQTVEAGAHETTISEAHDFNMSRIMELLSDPLLQEDI